MSALAPARAYLALGSNIGDKISHLGAALAAIAALPDTRILAASQAYRTPPWGKTDQDWFANAAVEIETSLSPEALLDAVLAIEARLGRIREERWGPRVIDIDVLSHGKTRLETPRLTLPHPAMAQRAFVLVPLREIAPDYRIGDDNIDVALARLDARDIVPIARLLPSQ